MDKIIINITNCNVENFKTLQDVLFQYGYNWSDKYEGYKTYFKHDDIILLNKTIYFIDNNDLKYLKNIIKINNKSFIRYLKIKNIKYGK